MKPSMHTTSQRGLDLRFQKRKKPYELIPGIMWLIQLVEFYGVRQGHNPLSPHPHSGNHSSIYDTHFIYGVKYIPFRVKGEFSSIIITYFEVVNREK